MYNDDLYYDSGSIVAQATLSAWRKLEADGKLHVAGEMDLPLIATRDQAFTVAYYIACECGYSAKMVGENQIRVSCDGKRFLVTYDNAARKLISARRIQD